MQEIKWAVLGTGVIVNEMAVALKKNGKSIYAVGNRTYDKAVAFADKYGIAKVYEDYNDMFSDSEVDVIYITTPHNTHMPIYKKLREILDSGKLGKVNLITMNFGSFKESFIAGKVCAYRSG